MPSWDLQHSNQIQILSLQWEEDIDLIKRKRINRKYIMKVIEHIEKAKGNPLFSFEILPPLKG